MGGTQAQTLTPTPPPPQLFGPWGGVPWGGPGAAGLGPRIPQHTYLKMIPSSH